MITFNSKYLYKLADLCTKEADKNAHQALDDDRIDGIQEKISGLFNIAHLNLDSQALKQAGYTLCNRISDLQKSLQGDSEKCELLKSKLANAFATIKSSLPEDFFTSTPHSELCQLFESEDLLTAFLQRCRPESYTHTRSFVRSLEVMFYKRNQGSFVKIMKSWINMHKLPIKWLPLSYTQLLRIIPHLHYVDLSSLVMNKFGFTVSECLKKYNLLINQSNNALHLSCAGGCIFDNGSQEVAIPFDEAIFHEICKLPRLESLDISHCLLVTGKELDVLSKAINIINLDVCDLSVCFFSNKFLWDGNLLFLTMPKLESLKVLVGRLTNEGLKKITACTRLKKLEIIFEERNKTHDLSCLKDLKNLKSLTIRNGFAFENEDFQFLEDLELNELCFDHCSNITNAIVSKLKTIQNLKFNVCGNISCDFVHENKTLANTLEILEIKNCSELGPLVKLTKMHTLILDVQGYREQSPLIPLLLPLEQATSLKHLTIKNSEIVDEHSKKLLRSIFPKLETLHFYS